MRRKKEDASMTRQQIIEACYQVILEKGFERMTREDVAARVGMTRGAVNWHFKEKEEMYLAALGYVLERLREEREQAMKQDGRPVMERLNRLFLMPYQFAEMFHFVNQIPPYLLQDERFRRIEMQKLKNRQEFITYMEQCLCDLEAERGEKLTQPRENLAQILYLLYEGLHNRNTAEEFQALPFHKYLENYFLIIIH